MNPLIHLAMNVMADKLLIDYKNTIINQKKELDGFHKAQKKNMIYIPSYYNSKHCVLCNTDLSDDKIKYKDMVWKSDKCPFTYNRDHSIKWNYEELTDIIMCKSCTLNETGGIMETWEREINGRNYIDMNNNIYYSLGFIQDKIE